MKNSFLSGAVILMAANAVSKILGAVFKIPLTYIIHEEGMAVYNTAFSVYAMFLTFIISGMPFAVQKRVAECDAEGNTAGIRANVRSASIFMIMTGAVCSAVMYIGADFLAAAMKEERAVWAIRAIAPSVFFVGCGAAVKSGFQGVGKMMPTAVSQVIEAAAKLVIGYYLAVSFIGLGSSKAAAGAVGGVTIGELIATAILVIWYMISFRSCARSNASRGILKKLLEIAVPMLCMSLITSAISMCDTSVLRACLLRAGMTADEARFTYGAYTGYAMTVLNLPSGFLATIGVSVIPVISGANAVGNMRRVRAAAKKGLTLAAIGAFVMCVGLSIWSEDILRLLFHNTYSSMMLRCAVPSVFFICIMQFSGAVLQSMDHLGRSFISVVSAVSVKLVMTLLLASRPEFSIYGSIIGTDLGFFIGAVLNMCFMVSAINKEKRE